MDRVVTSHPSDNERLRDLIHYELEARGGNPSGILELLSEAIQRRAWENLGLSFREFIEEPFPRGVGVEADKIQTIVDKFQHRAEREGPHHDPKVAEEMQRLRQRVRDLLAPALERRGRPSKDDVKADTVRLSEEAGNAASYALARLKRDRPDLAEQVIAGELSANAAAIKAGFRRRTITVPADPENAARTLRRRFSDEQLRVLIKLIEEAL